MESGAHHSSRREDVGYSTHNLQLHSLALQLNSPDLEVNTNSADVALGICVICETQQKTRLIIGHESVSATQGPY